MGWEGVVVWCGVSLSSHCLKPNHGFLAAIIHHISCIINPHHTSGYHLLATKQADIEMGPPNARERGRRRLGAWQHRRVGIQRAGAVLPRICGHWSTDQWTHWGLSPGPSACEADVIPLHHVPLAAAIFISERVAECIVV